MVPALGRKDYDGEQTEQEVGGELPGMQKLLYHLRSQAAQRLQGLWF